MVGARRTLAALAVGLAGLLVGAGPAVAAPPNPGDARNCGDFASWNEAQAWFDTYRAHGDVAGLDADEDGVACEGRPGAPTDSPPAPTTGAGYWMLAANGTVYGFGDARPLTPFVNEPVVAMAAGPDGGYWLLTASGVVHGRGVPTFGNAAVAAPDRVASIAGLPDGSGYWVFTRRGRALAFGAARPYGDMAGIPLQGEIVASAATPTGEGYWMVGADGGIFSFGDARFHGSTGGLPLVRPVVGIAPDPDGAGYWLVAADGGLFAFDAPFHGSVPGVLAPGQSLVAPVVGALPYGRGYLMVAADGGIFSFSDRPFLGSLGSTPLPHPVVGVAVRREMLPPS